MNEVKEEDDANSPLIIGGVGGGGTRIFRRIAEFAGYKMLDAPIWIRKRGSEYIHDHFHMRKHFYPRWRRPYMLGNMSKADEWRMRAACRFYLWLSGPTSYNKSGTQWGWKNPNTLFFIPFFNELFPSMRYLHVVRDGRHHAFHKRFDYAQGADFLFQEDELQLPRHVCNALFWSRCNQLTRSNAAQFLGNDRYLVTRFEDLISDPVEEISRIHSFLGAHDEEQIRTVAGVVKRPDSLDQWTREPQEKIEEVERYIGETLRDYDYQPTRVMAPTDERHLHREGELIL